MSSDPRSMIAAPPDGVSAPADDDGGVRGVAERPSRSRAAGLREGPSSRTIAFAVAIVLALSAVQGGGDAAAQENASETGSSVESILWESVKDGDDIDRLRRFLEAFPDGRFAEDARARLQDAQGGEGDARSARDRAANDGTSDERPPVDAPILFDRPIPVAIGSGPPRSLRALVQGHPLFPPVEGLGEEYWAKEECGSCHEWTRENLCVQGEFYAGRGDDVLARHRHPYGGTFKRMVRRWAEDGCR